MFNVYEETINVPLVVSNPVLFPRPPETDALASLVDVLPTMLASRGAEAADGGLRGHDLTPILADAAAPERERCAARRVDLGPVADHPAPAPSVQDSIHFTYDDHQAGTAMQERAGPAEPHPRDPRPDAKYAFYFDPARLGAAEYELYDLERDPDEVDNLLDVRTGAGSTAASRARRADLGERLDQALHETGTRLPA